MTDIRGNTTTATTWQDAHSGRRRHKLMTKELGQKIPAIGANEDVEDFDDVLAIAKLFSPYTGWRWYITKWDPETGTCFGLVEGFEVELGYSTSRSWRKQPCSARSPPWSAICTGSRRPSAR